MRFLNGEHPDKNVFLRLVQRARESGSLLPKRKANGCGAPRNARTVQNEENVLTTFNEDPTTSIRRVARNMNLSR
ncbi:hypothetical protein BDFB_015152, partial [Asbolus verrucosus]